MAYSLRLPTQLDADARLRCERLGISLNALLCVALDAYLRQPDQPGQAAGQAGGQPAGQAQTVAAAAQSSPEGGQAPETVDPSYPVFAAALTKAQRRELTAQQRQARK